MQTLIGHSAPIWCMTKLDEMLIASGSEDCFIKVWDWEYGDCVRTLLSHSYSIWGLDVDEEGNVGSGSWDKTVKIWNVKNK
mmetsp:Transcript_17355/g.2401  ORF Transcript_17355/g.2401 Transcript_17355/m.2401 type:complete len:81 (+) Transcript_17355:345-587(+)